MIDFVISGSRGFIGGHLVRRLRALGFHVASDHDLATLPQPAAVFVNCANIASSPSATVNLLGMKVALAHGRARTFVHLLSFSTLTGRGKLDLDLFNCGLRPRFANLYSAGKLEEERALIALLPAAPHQILIYLPAVLGEGGGWSETLKQSRAHGFALPSRMQRNARANWIDVDDIATYLIALRATPPRAGIQRIILNRAVSEQTTWADFLGGSERPKTQHSEDAGVPMRAREALVYLFMKAIALAARIKVLIPIERAFRKLKPVRPPETRSALPPMPAEPFVFRSLIRALARRQPYIPGHDPSAGKSASRAA
jgi:hypothetical protein